MHMTQPPIVASMSLAERYSVARRALSKADPVMAQLIAEHPDFDPRAFLAQLPKMDAFGTLLFQIIGQQLSVVATRAILTRLESLFGGRLPTPRELIDVGAEQVHAAGLSKRKVETMRALAQAFVDGDLEDDTLALTSDAEIEAKLTAIPGIGPWTVNGFLLIALDRPDAFPPEISLYGVRLSACMASTTFRANRSCYAWRNAGGRIAASPRPICLIPNSDRSSG
jgi:DNA-3-methyladenine glycosylase II